MVTEELGLSLAVALGGCLFGALFVFLGRRLWRSSRRLAAEGVSANATVVKKLRKPEAATWGGLEDYFVALAYRDHAGRERTCELKLMSKVWRQLAEGGSFGVSYLPQEPGIAFAGGVRAHKLRCGLAVVLMMFGVAALVLFPWAVLAPLLGIAHGGLLCVPIYGLWSEELEPSV